MTFYFLWVIMLFLWDYSKGFHFTPFFNASSAVSVVNIFKHHQENVSNHTDDKLLIGGQQLLINVFFSALAFFLVSFNLLALQFLLRDHILNRSTNTE